MEIRKTRQRLQTLEILGETGVSHGFLIASKAGLKLGTVYGILMAFEQGGFVESRWEDVDPQGRPRRKLYQLTDRGRVLLSEYRTHFGPEVSRGWAGALSTEMHVVADQLLGSMFRVPREREQAALEEIRKDIASS